MEKLHVLENQSHRNGSTATPWGLQVLLVFLLSAVCRLHAQEQIEILDPTAFSVKPELLDPIRQKLQLMTDDPSLVSPEQLQDFNNRLLEIEDKIRFIELDARSYEGKFNKVWRSKESIETEIAAFNEDNAQFAATCAGELSEAMVGSCQIWEQNLQAKRQWIDDKEQNWYREAAAFNSAFTAGPVDAVARLQKEKVDPLLQDMTDAMGKPTLEGPVVVRLSGKVQVQKGIYGAVEPIKAGDRLASGDVVRTAADGYLLVEFADETRIEVSANSSYTVEAKDANSSWLTLIMGYLHALDKSLRRGTPMCVVRTRTAVIAVRGTEYTAEVLEDGTERITVLQGEVEVASLNSSPTEDSMETTVSSNRLRPMERLTLNSDGSLQGIEAIAEDQIERWWENPAITSSRGFRGWWAVVALVLIVGGTLLLFRKRLFARKVKAPDSTSRGNA